MNTIRSVGYGWVFLCIAGGGSYYFAKRSINADRAERALAEEQRRQQRERLRTADPTSRHSTVGGRTLDQQAKHKDSAPNTTRPNSADPAPVEHAIPPSKFESSTPFKSPKGDRFS